VSVVALTYLPALAICPRTTRLTGLGDETRKKKKQLRSGVRMSPMLKDTWPSPAARSAEWKREAQRTLCGCTLPPRTDAFFRRGARPWAPAPWRDPHIWQRRKHAAGLARAPVYKS
jgi:hypothetical protein